MHLDPVAMLVEASAVDPSSLCPDPSHEKWREEEEHAQDPPLCLSSSCMTPTAVTAPAPTHSTPWPRQHPSSTRARPSRPVSPVHVASTTCAGHPLGAPVPAALAYKNPHRSNERAHPLPATSQTPSPLPARSSSTSPAPLARYWTRRVPPRSTSVKQADAENWWRRLAGVFSAHRRQALLPLRSPLSPSSSSLHAGELHPCRRTRCTSAVGLESVGSVPVRCG
jgi:hypothetical protein